MLTAAISAADPSICLPSFLPSPPTGKTIVLGAGKAGARMAETIEAQWKGPISGLVIVPYGYRSSCKDIEIVEASHPIPDTNGQNATEQIIQKVKNLSVGFNIQNVKKRVRHFYQ